MSNAKPRSSTRTRPSHLKTRRNQPLFPDRVLVPVAEMLAQLAQLAHALSDVVEDQRWIEAASALDDAVVCVRAPLVGGKESA